MKKIARQVPAIAAVSFAAMFGIGCASTGNLEQMVKDAQKTATEALDTAKQAQSTANSASSKADQAMSAANSASNTANSVKSAADDAQACCTANTERLNRMFEKSMRK
jgi:ABC-type microcin C transport system permease subunit YejB